MIDPDENEFRMRPSLPALALEKILEDLLLLPDTGKEGQVREEMPDENDGNTDRANCRDDKVAMSGKPMHPGF